jgi:poly(A) polymerase
MSTVQATKAARERAAALRLVRDLRAAGHVAYLAGGCVRDALLGLEPKDYDVATDAPPAAVHKLFRGSRSVGEAFGVVLVRSGGVSIEVATFRREWGYADGRRPAHVEFTDARADARRRDFTINGLFEDPLPAGPEPAPPGHAIIDYVGGRADLAAGVIRAIGDPEERFSEDYLRLLRAIRFAAALNFAIEPATAAAIRAHAASLAGISRERIGAEVRRMLSPPEPAATSTWRPARAALLMQDLLLDGPVLTEPHVAAASGESALPTLARLGAAAGAPERGTSHLSADPADRPARAGAETGVPEDKRGCPPYGGAYPVALAAWALDRELARAGGAGAAGHGAGLPLVGDKARVEDLVRRWRGALCLSNEERDGLAGILGLLPRALAWPALNKAQRKRLLAHPHFPAAAAVLRALSHQPAAAAAMDAIGGQAPGLHDEGVAPQPFVTGADLIDLGLQPGPAFGRLLREVYDAQLDGTLASREQALAWLRQHADGGKPKTA